MRVVRAVNLQTSSKNEGFLANSHAIDATPNPSPHPHPMDADRRLTRSLGSQPVRATMEVLPMPKGPRDEDRQPSAIGAHFPVATPSILGSGRRRSGWWMDRDARLSRRLVEGTTGRLVQRQQGGDRDRSLWRPHLHGRRVHRPRAPPTPRTNSPTPGPNPPALKHRWSAVLQVT